jgi:hypothetical protein
LPLSFKTRLPLGSVKLNSKKSNISTNLYFSFPVSFTGLSFITTTISLLTVPNVVSSFFSSSTLASSVSSNFISLSGTSSFESIVYSSACLLLSL